MSQKPLDKVKDKKNKIERLLADRKPISSADEAWLDNDANLVDFEVVVENLDSASDYDRGLERLDNEKNLVHKLREAAGDIAKVIGNKRKSISFLKISTAQTAPLLVE
ncbi:hypothetical protein H0H92_008962 [Tricholoma furcatifolium]|nr:hypothetical protein H0H92_008962 [Tricholoma furcatifolium]